MALLLCPATDPDHKADRLQPPVKNRICFLNIHPTAMGKAETGRASAFLGPC